MSQIEELRQIIIGNDSEVLHELKDRIEDIDKRTRDVAEVLPDAIDERVHADNKLVNSLKKPVFDGLKTAIRKEPEVYAEILYPVMAPSIRRMITQIFSSMMATINRKMTEANPLQTLKYRFEAKKLGIPYAELALRKYSPFKVDHIYLIERESGLLVKEMHGADVESLDGDAVGAMFSAIQSFMRDSFSQDSKSRLTDFKSEHQNENQNVWLIHGSKLILACVISGDAPESLREKLYETSELIHSNYANQLADFDGNVNAFDGIDDILTPIVEIDEVKVEEKKSSVGKYLLVIFLACILLAIGVYYLDRYNRMSGVEYNFQRTPGIAMTDSYWEDGKVVIKGLQDPDAVIPYDELESKYRIGRDDLVLDTIPFRSLEASMELQRFNAEFVLPEGLEFNDVDGKIKLSGETSITWLKDNDLRIRQLAADGRLDVSGLSASLSSVSQLLGQEFSEDQLTNVSSSIISNENNQDVVQLFGRMNKESLDRLKSIFSNSYWVEVAILSYQ